MIKPREYGVALFLFALAGFAASSKLAHWEHPNIRLGNAVRISGHILIIFAFVFLTIVTFSIKRKDPWSNVPFAVQRLMVLLRPASQPDDISRIEAKLGNVSDPAYRQLVAAIIHAFEPNASLSSGGILEPTPDGGKWLT